MKMKKIFAAAAASVVAASAMSIVASAAGLMSKTGNSSGAESYKLDFTGLTDDQIKSIVKIEADFSLDSDFANGCIGYNSVAADDWAKKDQDATASGKWEITFDAGDLAATGDDGSIAPYGEVQFWWVNNIPDTEDEGTITLNSVKYYDASGNEVKAGSSSGSDTTKDPVDTGVEGIAAVFGVAVVAAGAMVVAKKRK